MSEFAAINALRKSERDLTKANAELSAKNTRLQDELAASQRDHANARAWILQMQAEQKDLVETLQATLTALRSLAHAVPTGENVDYTFELTLAGIAEKEAEAAIAKATGQEAQNAS